MSMICSFLIKIYIVLVNIARAAERGAGGGQIAPGPEVLGPLKICCWAPVFFVCEIFTRKGQDIWVF
jgi:hypothetical protein